MKLNPMVIGKTSKAAIAIAMLFMVIANSNSIFAQDSIAVAPAMVPQTAKEDSTEDAKALFRKDVQHVKTFIHNEVQFSVVPGISTNRHLQNKKTVHAFSFNLVKGEVYGVRFMELGAILNQDEANVSYIQMAGVGNTVGGTVMGVQSAGIFNRSGSVIGAQHAGIVNRVKGQFVGVQHAGIVNLVSQNFKGGQFAGIINHSDSLVGFQGAGVLNRASDVYGMQAAGILNRANNIRGTQLAGIINLADTVKGVQITSIINRAKVVKGFQFGLVNIADTIDGACLGLINIVKHGYNRWEVSGDEVFYANVAYRSGVQKLHTILSTGMMPEKFNGPTWTIGAGVGMSFGRPNKTLLDIEIMSQQVVERDRFLENHMLHKFYVGIDQPISPKLSLAFGVSYNVFIYYKGDENRISEIMPYSIYSENLNGRTMMDSWIGGKIALRFR